MSEPGGAIVAVDSAMAVELAELEQLIHHHHGAAYDISAWTAGEFAAELPDKFALSVAWHGDRGIAGFAIGYRFRGDWGHISRLGVAPEHQRRGIAGRLLREQLTRMESAGIRRVTVDLSQANTAAARLYERSGFQRLQNGALEEFVHVRSRQAAEYLGEPPSHLAYELRIGAEQ